MLVYSILRSTMYKSRRYSYLFLNDFLNVLDGSHFSLAGCRAHELFSAESNALV